MQYVYGLFDPRTDHIRYIGRTNDPNKRLKGHLNPNNRYANLPKIAWIEDLERANLSPYMEILETTDEGTVIETENFYIGYFRMLGANLTNGTWGENPKRVFVNKKPISFLIGMDEETLTLLEQKAKEEHMTRAALIRKACQKYVGLPN